MKDLQSQTVIYLCAWIFYEVSHHWLISPTPF